LTVDTSGVSGELVFMLEVSAPGVQATSSDQVTVFVEAPFELEVNAGSDVNAVSGDLVSLQGSAVVLQGVASPSDFTWTWTQSSGPAVSFQQNGPELVVDTAGVIGDVTFTLMVSVTGVGATAMDEVTVFVASRPVQLTAGKWHNAYLDGYGRMQMWGRDREGQTGDGSMVSALGGVDATRLHSVLVTDAGFPFAFGEDVFGSSPAPKPVPGATDVVQVAALGQGAFMLTASMQVLGVNSGASTCALAGATSRDSSGALLAVAIPGLPQSVVEVAAGESHGCAVDDSGGGWVWGSRFGCSPRRVLTGATDVAAGDMDVCLFVRDDGTAWSIGYNIVGQLGVGNTVSNYTTARQVLGLTDVVDVAAGDRHSFFLKGDGTLWATGWNRYCQLGLEDSVSPVVYQFGYVITQPVQVDLADVVAVAGGGTHSVAVTADGTVWGWGENVLGQLTRGTGTSLPVEVCMPMPLQLP
jgi:alpha-tubulin suppressor-like RCC1 family protein